MHDQRPAGAGLRPAPHRELPAERVRPVIAGMRGFLEGKPELIPPDVDLSAAEDGYQAVEILARAAGLSAGARSQRHGWPSRADLVGQRLGGRQPTGSPSCSPSRPAVPGRVLAEPGDPAAAAVLDALGIDGRRASSTGRPAPRSRTRRWCWSSGPAGPANWQSAQHAGCATALVDRFGRGRGTPTYRVDRPAGPARPRPLLARSDDRRSIRHRARGRTGPMTTRSERDSPVRRLADPGRRPARAAHPRHRAPVGHPPDLGGRPVQQGAGRGRRPASGGRRAARTRSAQGRRLDAVVLSGDLTDTGDPDAYRRLAAAGRDIDRGPALRSRSSPPATTTCAPSSTGSCWHARYRQHRSCRSIGSTGCG